MLYREEGSVFLGYTKQITCTHCNQVSAHQVWQGYLKQKLFFVPIGTSHGRIFKLCKICEHEDPLIKWKHLFASEQKKDALLESLDSGKEFTKQWVATLSYSAKEAYFKRLNSLGASSLVKYLGS